MTRGGRVLVTGAGGSLGGQVAHLMAGRGFEVYGAYRSQPGDGEIKWLRCDLVSVADVKSAVEAARPSLVLHAAGRADTADLDALVEANATAFANLAAALRGSRVQRIVVIGSGAEYAPGSARELVAEDQPLRPASNYGLSKLRQYEISREEFRRGQPIVYARPFNLIGPGVSRVTAVGDVTVRLAGLIAAGVQGELEVGDLNRWRDYLDVRDAAAACLTLLESGVPGSAYNVCSGVPVLLSDVVARLLELAGPGIALRRIEREESRVSFSAGDPARLRGLGWAPRIGLDASLKDGLEGWLAASRPARS